MFSCCADTQSTANEIVQEPQSVQSVAQAEAPKTEAPASTPAETKKEEAPAEPKDTSFK
eukprot:CAMPEP_0197622708 /NCGR_PEP_ID=MMETSP1338-20131121/2894_1 /TAXON_ID=43686 ORGANISM="Pelagodinium beii, Strain RCC1491" /NCGR_SAMPLE_ID=MMETSP1338 /ASSEMBLY_ACC=CAM_ASM_000754 /LENGTH=58 /DNA_ID=CAMNT_0043192455 /DNA_START=122 /DNA_END=295 /DNA_ORIENTATION=+